MTMRTSTRPDAITADELQIMHPALVGDGERAAVGLPRQNALMGTAAPVAAPVNMLTGGGMTGQAAPPLGVNMLTGQTAPPPAPPPPAAMPAPPEPAAPAGQAASTAIGLATGAHKMSDDELSKGFDRLEYIRSALGNMTRQASPPTHDDVLAAVAKGVKDGIFPAAEAGQIMGGLTSDPAKLPAELEQRHKFALHQMVHLAGEMQKRTDAAKLGAS